MIRPLSTLLILLGPLCLGGDLLRQADWHQRWYRETIETAPLPDSEAPTFSIAWPGDFEYVVHNPDLPTCDAVIFKLRSDKQMPDGAVVSVFTKDWDDLWRQCRFSLAGASEWTLRIPWRGPNAAQAWAANGHDRPWHQLTPAQLIEVGLKFELEGVPREHACSIRLESISAEQATEPLTGEVRNLKPGPTKLPVGSLYELAFETSHAFEDPFDRQDVDLYADILRPDGRTIPVRLFYYEGFALDRDRFTPQLEATGMPQFRLRYTPVVAGEHTVRIRGRIGAAPISLAPIAFSASESPQFRGFVQRSDDDPLLLKWSNQDEEFCAIGLNVRSPYDNRYRESFPYTAWEDEDILMYERLFKTYAARGIDTVEVWMSSWWLALEWIPDAPGNHGIGYFNPWRAWKLDLIFRWAAQYDIKICLLIHNHGKFSTWCDAEWERNPFNRKHGGPVEEPRQFFTDPTCLDATRKLLDYLVARWGYSPHLYTWKLFSEIDLTGKSREWYKLPPMATFHQQMGAYLKQIDPNQHIVSTHWSTNYRLVNESVAKVPELDVILLDAYYFGSGANKLYGTIRETGDFALKMNKPCVITEFGGNPWGDTMGHIVNQHHLGLWGGYFHKMASVPFFWWFPMLEEHPALYKRYEGISTFIKGEDRTGATFSSKTPGKLGHCIMRMQNGRLLGWVFDRSYYYGGRIDRGAIEIPDQTVKVELESGLHTVEYWSTTRGQIVAKDQIFMDEEGKAKLHLPSFKGDIAFKVFQASQ